MTRDDLIALQQQYRDAEANWQRQAEQAQANVHACQGAEQAIQDIINNYYPAETDTRLSDVLATAGLTQT